MDPWTTIESLTRRGVVTDAHIAEAHRLVRSAAAAGMARPRLVVGRELLQRLWAGEPADEALTAIEDQLAIEHNRTLIARGSGRPAARLVLVSRADDPAA